MSLSNETKYRESLIYVEIGSNQNCVHIENDVYRRSKWCILIIEAMTDIEERNQKWHKSEFCDDVYRRLVVNAQRRKTETTHIGAT